MRLEICRMLGYNYGLPTIQSRFGAVPATFAMDDVACIGNEASLLDCPHNSQDNCGANEGAGVICENCGKVVMKLWVFCSLMVFGKRVLLSKSIFSLIKNCPSSPFRCCRCILGQLGLLAQLQ